MAMEPLILSECVGEQGPLELGTIIDEVLEDVPDTIDEIEHIEFFLDPMAEDGVDGGVDKHNDTLSARTSSITCSHESGKLPWLLAT